MSKLRKRAPWKFTHLNRQRMKSKVSPFTKKLNLFSLFSGEAEEDGLVAIWMSHENSRSSVTYAKIGWVDSADTPAELQL